MRKAVVLISLMVFGLGLAHGNWDLVTEYNETTSSIDGGKVYFIDPQHGLIVNIWPGGGGSLVFSRDSGKTWSFDMLWNNTRWSRPMERAYDAYPFNKDTIWLTGRNTTSINDRPKGGVIYKTIDGGSTWDIVFSDSLMSAIEKILFTQPSDGYFFGRSSASSNHMCIGKTKDGGVTWTVKEFDSLTFNNAFFINADTGWVAVGSRWSNMQSRFLRTVNGGNSWENIEYNFNTDGPINTFYFTDSKRGWRAGGVIEYTEDGGDTWKHLHGYRLITSPHYRLNVSNIHFINDSTGWFLGIDRDRAGVVHYTTNGGKDWEAVEINRPVSGTYSLANSMSFVGPYGWIVGDRSLVYRTTDYGGLSDYITSVNPQLRQRQNTNASSFNMRISPAKGDVSNITYTLNTESTLSISVYNLKGKKIASQPKRLRTAGEHNFSFKAPKGFYIVEAKVQSKSGENERTFSNRVLVK